MKRNYIIYIVISCIALLSSCQNNMLNAGASSLDQQDEIRVMADTFLLTSTLQECAAIRFTPDSFLLGECDTRFGTIKADILTQLACPLGNEYPYADQATVDSVVLYLYYQNWYGDGLSPLGINVYEMDVATLDYSSSYPSDTTLSSFCSLSESTHIAERSRIAYAARHTDSIALTDGSYMPCISVKLTDDFAKRFFAIKDFSSQEQFNQLFKGLYITTDFGGSTVLYIKQINMAVFYSFDAPHDQQQDSIIHSAKIFYANSEVRQLNRYIFTLELDGLANASCGSQRNQLANGEVALFQKIDHFLTNGAGSAQNCYSILFHFSYLRIGWITQGVSLWDILKSGKASPV